MSNELITATPPTPEEAAQYLDESRRIAAANLLLLAKRVAEKALADTATQTQVLAAAEFNYKLSGLAAKQSAAGPGIGGFRVSFNFNASKPSRGITIEATPEPAEPPLLPEDIPAHLLSLAPSDDLRAEVAGV